MLKRYAALAVAVVAVAALAQGASADPLNAKNSLVIPATCEGQTVEVVVNGNGEFTPGHVLGSTSVFIPQSFNLTFTFTPTVGPPQTETDTAAKANPHGALVTCTINFTTSFPEGMFNLSGTVTGFFTPA